MAMSVNPAIEGNQPLSSGHCDPAAMIGPRSTVPIRARGHVVPHQQAVHMTATGRTCTRGKTLANRGPSTHDGLAAPALDETTRNPLSQRKRPSGNFPDGQFVVPAKAGTQEQVTEIPGFPLSRERRI